MSAPVTREESSLERSPLDEAVAQFSSDVDTLAQSLKERASNSASARVEGKLAHPSAFVESITAQISLPAGCLFVGHTNTDLDSVGGAVGAAELYDGRACLAQPPVELNGEVCLYSTHCLAWAAPPG